MGILQDPVKPDSGIDLKNKNRYIQRDFVPVLTAASFRLPKHIVSFDAHLQPDSKTRSVNRLRLSGIIHCH